MHCSHQQLRGMHIPWCALEGIMPIPVYFTVFFYFFLLELYWNANSDASFSSIYHTDVAMWWFVLQYNFKKSTCIQFFFSAHTSGVNWLYGPIRCFFRWTWSSSSLTPRTKSFYAQLCPLWSTPPKKLKQIHNLPSRWIGGCKQTSGFAETKMISAETERT